MALLNNIAIGTYVPAKSLVHRLNPLAKIIAMIILLVGIFIIKDISVYVATTILIIILIKISKLSVIEMIKRLKIMAFMFVFLFIINSFVIRTGDLLFELSFFKLYTGAIYQTCLILFRLTLMVFVSSLLTMTTKPLDLTLGLEQMFNPLKKIGFPAHELAMMISIALRFIPLLVEETNKIMVAQTSRGVDFQSNKLSVKVKAIISLLIPLFTSSIKRAEDLADAMEARGYSPDAERTRFNQYKWQNIDTIAIIISIIYTGVVTWYSITN
ncbi:energy-coupling factor transporter transmembrane component T family protein [Mycoplasma sp. P36-A1]|uniref:energy-coupling factor transporter transmembrane component T family protein n=1 Tax=Mycoplasma sp. P36-A1 TaxID=3252900 RepID=UPI003C2B631E